MQDKEIMEIIDNSNITGEMIKELFNKILKSTPYYNSDIKLNVKVKNG